MRAIISQAAWPGMAMARGIIFSSWQAYGWRNAACNLAAESEHENSWPMYHIKGSVA